MREVRCRQDVSECDPTVSAGCINRRWWWIEHRAIKLCRDASSPYLNLLQQVESKEFWRWCKTLRIAGFLDFAHRPEFWTLANTTFWKLDLFPFSGERRGTCTQLGPVIEVSSFFETQLSRHKNGKRSSFRNVVFSSYLEFMTINNVEKSVILTTVTSTAVWKLNIAGSDP
jgi:hypothetical protein